jgi:hypothetical protein
MAAFLSFGSAEVQDGRRHGQVLNRAVLESGPADSNRTITILVQSTVRWAVEVHPATVFHQEVRLRPETHLRCVHRRVTFVFFFLLTIPGP